jgi:hypothetical protein
MPDLQEFPAFVLIFGNSVKLIAPGLVFPHFAPGSGARPCARLRRDRHVTGCPNGLGATVCMR